LQRFPQQNRDVNRSQGDFREGIEPKNFGEDMRQDCSARCFKTASLRKVGGVVCRFRRT
jgi:hypothetical protein